MTAGHGPLHDLGAIELAARIRSRDVSPVEVVQAHLDRIDAVDARINAMVTVCADSALEAARALESAMAAGTTPGPLAGVPFTVKDCLDTAGVPTQRGSRIFAGRVPGTVMPQLAKGYTDEQIDIASGFFSTQKP